MKNYVATLGNKIIMTRAKSKQEAIDSIKHSGMELQESDIHEYDIENPDEIIEKVVNRLELNEMQ